MLLNGEYFNYNEIPKSYLLINILMRSPEYLLFSYLIFLFSLIYSSGFFKFKIKLFNYKITIVLSMLIYPFLLLYFTPFSIYDGLRHVLWMIPYLCIIPALAIFYLWEKINLLMIKLLSTFLIASFGFFFLILL